MKPLAARLQRAVLAAFLAACAACSGGDAGSDASPAEPAFDPSFLDVSTEPCSDFYQFACGTWLAQHPPRSGSFQQRFGLGDQRLATYFSQLLDAMSSPDRSLGDAQTFYRACLSAHTATSASAPALQRDLQVIAGLSSLDALPRVLAQLHGEGVGGLFWVSPQVDVTEPSRYVLAFRESGWSLATHLDYDDEAIAEEYRRHIAALASLVSSSAGLDVQLDPVAIFDFERALARLGNDDRDPRKQHEVVDAAELAAAAPSIDWPQYFANRGYPDVPRVDAGPPGFLAALDALLATTDPGTLAQYLAWRLLESNAELVDRPLLAEERLFHQGETIGVSSPRGDEYECLLATRSSFGFTLASYFTRNFVAADTRPQGRALVASLRERLATRLAEVDWLDDATRARALDKQASLIAKVGYPDQWPVESIGSGGGSYLELWRQTVGAQFSEARHRSSQPVDRSALWLSPEVTNAFYRPALNDITIPVAILQRPFFDPSQAASYGYGALGTIIGHELTHAFDDMGRHFDGDGKLVDWWSEGTSAEFEQRAQCLVDQFSREEAAPGIAVDGVRTLGENIADLGGLRLAWQAFQLDPGHDQSSGEYDADQQFFLSYAQMWCASFSDVVLEQRAKTDPHSPAKLRVNGVLRNMPEFASAFACAAGEPLAPEDRCEVW